jgi:hypothetical protein
LLDHGADTAASAPHNHAHLLGLLGQHRKPSVAHSFPSRDEAQVKIAVQSSRFLPVKVIVRIEPLHLAGDLHIEIAGVKQGCPRNARLALDESAPG